MRRNNFIDTREIEKRRQEEEDAKIARFLSGIEGEPIEPHSSQRFARPYSAARLTTASANPYYTSHSTTRNVYQPNTRENPIVIDDDDEVIARIAQELEDERLARELSAAESSAATSTHRMFSASFCFVTPHALLFVAKIATSDSPTAQTSVSIFSRSPLASSGAPEVITLSDDEEDDLPRRSRTRQTGVRRGRSTRRIRLRHTIDIEDELHPTGGWQHPYYDSIGSFRTFGQVSSHTRPCSDEELAQMLQEQELARSVYNSRSSFRRALQDATRSLQGVDLESYEGRLRLDEDVVKVGLTNAQIEALPKFKYVETDGDKTCNICLSEFVVDEEITLLPCLHKFHSPCISQWLKQSKICPICRSRIEIC